MLHREWSLDLIGFPDGWIKSCSIGLDGACVVCRYLCTHIQSYIYNCKICRYKRAGAQNTWFVLFDNGVSAELPSHLDLTGTSCAIQTAICKFLLKGPMHSDMVEGIWREWSSKISQDSLEYISIYLYIPIDISICIYIYIYVYMNDY